MDTSRIALGEQSNHDFQVHGTKGAAFWDFRGMNELGVPVGSAYQTRRSAR